MNNILKSLSLLSLLFVLIVSTGCEKMPTAIQPSNKNDFKENENDLTATPQCIDADGNVYQVVKIGNQWWMAENLKTTHFQNLDPIDEVRDKNAWRTLTKAAYCYYDNDHNTEPEYGLLYNWKAATDERNIAPTGWHVPSDEDYQILENYLGGRHRAGGKLKEAGTEHWDQPNQATNSSGFTALPGGQRDYRGDFMGKRGFGFYWTTTEHEVSGAWNRYMDHLYEELEKSNFQKRCGHSIRCVLNADVNNVAVTK